MFGSEMSKNHLVKTEPSANAAVWSQARLILHQLVSSVNTFLYSSFDKQNKLTLSGNNQNLLITVICEPCFFAAQTPARHLASNSIPCFAH